MCFGSQARIRLFNAAALDAREKISLSAADVAEGAIASVVRNGGEIDAYPISYFVRITPLTLWPSWRLKPRRLVLPCGLLLFTAGTSQFGGHGAKGLFLQARC